MPKPFAQQILAWFAKSGRKDLPWQHPKTPYRVWVSEIMLQQTQVTTVIPYFQRFIKHFPNLASLAKAPEDQIFALWAGLGFYARARNLHKTAKILHETYKDKFPKDLTTLQSLPGIGRSTAGAILSLSMNQPAPILDGNVKRILMRYHAVKGWFSQTKVQQQLWQLAEHHLPQTQSADYTQALMDLGALICTPQQPNCQQCPLKKQCLAYAEGTPTAYPVPKPKLVLPIRSTNLLIISNSSQEILLEKRPAVGIWGGLWCLPEYKNNSGENITCLSKSASTILEQTLCNEIELSNWCKQNYHCDITACANLPMFRHTFSHFHLDITPWFLSIDNWQPPLMESSNRIWHNAANLNTLGLPAPVKKIIKGII